jgi:MFS family permease
VNPTAAFIFALLAFAADSRCGPFGALVFGRLGDLVGRKYTLLVTILIMGMSTFIVGICPATPRSASSAPVILILLRLLQGLALGGEYGGRGRRTWRSMRRTGSAVRTRRGSRRRRRSGSSSRCS